MKRSFDPTPFNTIGNDPDVRPWLAGQAPIDATALVTDLANFCFLTEDRAGAYIYHRKQPGLYEVHSLAVPCGRGRSMLKARTESLRFMFTATDALEIVTVVPDGNRTAGVWAAHAGFREVFRREDAVWIVDGLRGASYRTLTYAEWVMHDLFNREVGRQVHEELHRHVPDDHGDDPAHDAFVGATFLGIHEGNGGKATATYNRWAAHAGYLPITTLSLNPPLLDIGSAVVQITSRGLEVLHVRAARSATSENQEEREARSHLERQSAEAPAS